MAEPDSLTGIGPLDVIRHFWRRMPLYIGFCLLAGIATAAFVYTAVGRQYTASATLMVREPTAEPLQTLRLESLEPPVYEDIFLNDQILFETIQEARAKYPGFPQVNWEQRRSSFEVEYLTTRDTSVSTTYSPVLRLSASFNNPEIAKFLMDTWLRKILTRFGQMRTRQANAIREFTTERLSEIETEMADLAAEQTRQQRDLTELRRTLETQTAQPEQKEREASLAAALETIRSELNLLRAEAAQIREVFAIYVTDMQALSNPFDPDGAPPGELVLLAEPVQPEGNTGTPRALVAAGIFLALALAGAFFLILELLVRKALEEGS